MRTLPPFTKINLKDNVNVFITQGNPQEVRVEGGENLIPLIKAEVINGELFLENDNRCNWARSYKKGTINVYITMPVLRYISHNGSGQIKGQDTIVCDTLDVLTKESGDVELTIKAKVTFSHIHSTSDATLHGISFAHGIYHVGEGVLHYEDLRSDDIWTYSDASGNEYLNSKNFLIANIHWVGDIYYTGNPTTTILGSGSGKLIHQN